MDRLFSVFLLITMLAFASACMHTKKNGAHVQPVFFSMLFPQLMPEDLTEKPEEREGKNEEENDQENGSYAKAVML